jgi:hypothetical protein
VVTIRLLDLLSLLPFPLFLANKTKFVLDLLPFSEYKYS